MTFNFVEMGKIQNQPTNKQTIPRHEYMLTINKLSSDGKINIESITLN